MSGVELLQLVNQQANTLNEEMLRMAGPFSIRYVQHQGVMTTDPEKNSGLFSGSRTRAKSSVSSKSLSLLTQNSRIKSI